MKNIHKLENIGHSDLMCAKALYMDICIKYQGSLNNQIGMRGG